MPIYEYKCDKGHVFDVMQRFSDDPVETCETCGAPVQRVFRAPAVHFKGKGFYSTDYGSKKRARELKAAAEGSSSSNGDKSSSDSKSDSKSETTSKSESSSKPDSSKTDSKPPKSAAA